MLTAREIMTADVTCVGESESLSAAAHTMVRLGVDSLPVRGADDRIRGMLTDRDILAASVAADRDPSCLTAAEAAHDCVTVAADDDAAQVLHTMGRCRVRRLPVLDGDRLVGVVALADLAWALPDWPVGDLRDAVATP
ncbi:CBS domain-containing protein [Actinoplanes sp. RD1]|uniref:CBS domain-containing protein n=1 Tax=Actinoplanes sp. RD1 TaxID=3064538 RepID=UPI0027424551|nr:CBS domain-containing protein [Actinoplanes sp. RD1]